jgi:group I intron endonuclease
MNYYYLYEIKNTVNGKIYVGVHKTKSLNDGYMGSGKVIAKAIEKYGIENFTKTILETFDNPAAMYAREKEVVNDDFLRRADVYNLRRGGTGGFDYINKSGLNNSASNGSSGAIATNNKRKADPVLYQQFKDRSSAQLQKLHAAGKVPHDNFKDKRHSAETKNKISLANAGRGAGSNNSQSGTCWVFCEKLQKNLKIKKELLPLYIEQGWTKGRRMK